jgi:hypothetical protein
MATFLGADLWDELTRFGRKVTPRVVVVAYYTDDSRVRCGEGDTIVTDATDGAIVSGRTSAKLLLAAAKRGARVYSHPHLHAKVVAFPGCAFVGSANLSSASANLREAGVLLTDTRNLRAVERYALAVQREAHPLSTVELQRLAGLPVHREGNLTREKPSLLVALRDDLTAILDTLAFGFSEGTPVTATTVVSREARSSALVLPSRWTFFEAFDRPGVLRSTKQACEGRSLVEFPVRSDASASITTFRPNVRRARQFIGAFPHNGYVFSVFGPLGARVALDLEREREGLAKLLTSGVRRARPSLIRRISNDAGVLATSDLQELCNLGREAG